MRTRDALVRLGPAIAYVALVFICGLIPVSAVATEVTYGDKVLHGVVFGVMVVLWLRALTALRPGSGRRARLLAAFLIAVALGAGLELLQHLFPPRAMELLDFLADVAGAALASGALVALTARRSRRAGSGAPLVPS